MRLALVAVLTAPLYAQVCGLTDLSGTYGFHFSGHATISGTPAPLAAIGRLAFDNSGKIAGTSSVNFNGLFLGNPVTGIYELKQDCTVSWSLRDDSGAWQHFQGTLQPGGSWGSFHQTDPGAAARGNSTPAQSTVTAADGNGNFTWSSEAAHNSGAYQVDADCFVELDFGMK